MLALLQNNRKFGERMKKSAFYKEYYEITNKIYADKTIWSAQERENACHKGQIYTSKCERLFYIMAQYCILLTTVILSAALSIRYGIIGLAAFFLCVLITDFSVTKIELLYYMFFRSSPYSELLYKAFTGRIDDFWGLIRPAVKKNVSGFARENSGKFIARYLVIFRKRQERLTITINPFGIKLRSKGRNIFLNNRTATISEIADAIAEVINSQ